jgi:hypothetical protein
MKRKPRRKPNLTKHQLACLRRRVLRGDPIPSGVAHSLLKKGYVSGSFYRFYHDRHGNMSMVSDNLPTDKARRLINR